MKKRKAILFILISLINLIIFIFSLIQKDYGLLTFVVMLECFTLLINL